MKKEVILIFDVGKTNKKVVLFDRYLSLLYLEESRFEEVMDDDAFPCEDAVRLELWIRQTLRTFLVHDEYLVKGVNFSTYGATIVCLDKSGNRLTPIYNYLKPMPENLLDGFYERYGGVQEFSRKTASPALGMLNSGLQLLWLKRTRPEVFGKIGEVLHLPQYLSYIYTKRITSEHTSLGCHTALWDFDRMQYHQWLKDEGINLPEPGDLSATIPVQMEDRTLEVGVGIHDSSASLVPYIMTVGEPFILVSTGTWSIHMNPFNHDPLTAEELAEDCLCFMSVNRKPVRSSRFFLGHIHDVNVQRLESHYKMDPGFYKGIIPENGEIAELWKRGRESHLFFSSGVPAGYVDLLADLGKFSNFREAYVQLMLDLTKQAIRSIQLIITGEDPIRILYITGGFARNPFFTGLIKCAFPEKKVYTSQVDNASALGAAVVITGRVWDGPSPDINLGLAEVPTS